MTKHNNIKFVENDRARLYECHLFIVSVSTTRTGLIEAYRAAKISLGPGLLLAQLVTAIRIRQEELIAAEMAATNGK